MKKLKNISYAAAVLLVTTAISCNKQLEEDNQHDTTVENQYTNPEGFTTLVNTAYQDLHEFYGNEDGELECEAGTDLWYAGNGRGSYGRQYVYYDGLGPSQGQSVKAWQYSYRSINYCNLGISLIDEAGFTDETLKNQRLSELRFLRAMYYYHIVEQFGNVVLRTEPTSEGAEPLDYRSPVEDFYDLMISDLEFARDNLPVSWSATDYSRASKKSAMGLLARVLLTRAYYSSGSDAQSWFTKAKDAAVDVINNQSSLGISLYSTYAEIAPSIYGSNRQNNKEAMFVLAYSETNASSNYNVYGNGNEIFKWTLTKYIGKPGMTGSFVNAYGWGEEPRLMPTWHFLDLFDETKDARYAACFNEVWISNVSSPYTWTTADVDPAKYDKDASVVGQQIKAGDTAMYLTKNALPYDRRFQKFIAVGRNDLYVNPQPGQGANIAAGTVITQYYPSFKKWINVNKTTTTNADFGDAMIIRLAEMYMIAAEAYLQLGDKANAASMINVIRKRAAIPGHETEMEITAGDVDINFILDERARELAGEQQRWYDLKRVYHDKQAWVDYIKKWNPDMTLIQSHHWLRPIPKAELDAIENAAEFGQNEGYQ